MDTGYVPKVYGRSNLDARVIITAIDDSWVQVQGPDNELLLTRILHAGDTYRVPDRPGLLMVTGNAGGLEIQVDNAPAPALGPLGVVIRNICARPGSPPGRHRHRRVGARSGIGRLPRHPKRFTKPATITPGAAPAPFGNPDSA